MLFEYMMNLFFPWLLKKVIQQFHCILHWWPCFTHDTSLVLVLFHDWNRINSTSLWGDFRLSRQWVWRWLSSGVLCHVVW
jgi:hypothetical protein